MFSFSLKASDIKIIELHKNISLDQLVLDSTDEELENNDNKEITDNEENEGSEEDITIDLNDNSKDLINIENSKNTNPDDIVTVSQVETIFDLNKKLINENLEMIDYINSNTLHREFIEILSSPEISNQEEINNKIFFVIKKLYELGEIGKAYKLIKNIELNNILDKEELNYIYLINLNYLFSTFKLSEACEFKSFLIDEAVILAKFLLEKTDIFCLTLENNFAEAKLLNSLLLDSEKETDINFQKLFKHMVLNGEDNKIFEALTNIKSKELIFLYSAMLRINELPLNKDFIEIDPLNLSIPVILSDSTSMDIRIKAANTAFYDEVISIESLSALYQSVDFNSKDFNNPEITINSLGNNNELKMAFYYQLANIQIFPDQRLEVIINYWKFAKNQGLEKIAYALTKNIIDKFNPTIENTKFAIEIALAHISNKNFNESLKWINIYENSNHSSEKIEYAKFLISLNETNELDTIIDYLSTNYSNLSTIKDQKIHETLQVLINFLNLNEKIQSDLSYDKIIDDRLMPSYFLIRDIEKNIDLQNDLSIFILTLISINDKNWTQLHPQHLNIILKAYNFYDQGSLIKPILIEILDELEIF